MRELRLPRSLYDELVAHAREDAPNECCGMVASVDGRAVAVHRARNTAASPFRYEMDPKEQLRLELGIEDAGQELGAIYHSHTRSAPEPSQTDVNLAGHPHALYVIVGVKDAEPDVRAWSIVVERGPSWEVVGAQVDEARLIVE